MKRSFTLFIFLIAFTILGAQDKRVVLIEQFTQASCPPCAPANVRIQGILKDYTEDEVVILRYQASFPGHDPMFDHNPRDVRNKQTYYGIRSVPSSIIDGTNGPAHPNSIINKTNLNAAKRVSPLCRIECDPGTSVDGETIQVHCKVTALEDFVGDEVAIIAIIEKHIQFDAPPGSNGEKEFFNVMKKLLPRADGEELPKLKKDESYEFDVSWKFTNIYSIPQVAMIAFVQNSKSKKVYQALHIPKIIQSKYANDGQITWISIDNDLDDNTTCNTYANPVIEIANRGHDVMTSAVIEYSVNNSAPKQYEWTGSLDYYESEQVVLPEISYNFASTNIVRATIKQVNGADDEFADNNSTDSEFDLAPITTQKLIFDFRSLTRPNKMSFSIVNSLKEVVFEYGPFSRSEKTLKKEIDLADNECFEIIINNKAPGSSNGRVTIKDDAGLIIFATRHIPYGLTKKHITTDDFIRSEDVLNDANQPLNWSLNPNPAGNATAIQTHASRNMLLKVRVQNLLGKSLGNLEQKIQKGDDQIELNLNSLQNGVYLITVQHDDASPQTKKLLVRR